MNVSEFLLLIKPSAAELVVAVESEAGNFCK